MPQLPYKRLVLLLLLVSGVFFTGLGSARLWDRDEPRNARASHEMLQRGDWVVPTFNGELRDHKPILLYWAQMTSYLAFGQSEFTARLPSALASLLSVFAVALLASRLSGKSKGLSQEGFWCAGAFATCLLLVMAGRAATPDACLIAFSTLGIAALVLSTLSPVPPYSVGRVDKARWLPAMFGYAMLGVAVLAKGPVGLILPVAVVHVWWLVCKKMQEPEVTRRIDSRQNRSIGQYIIGGLRVAWSVFNPLQLFKSVWNLKLIPGVCVALCVAAPWYVLVGIETEGAFLRGFFLDHNVGRAMGEMEGHGGSVFFYPIAFLVGTFPWSLWLIPILTWCHKVCRDGTLPRQAVVLAAVWCAVYVGAFSVAQTKLPSYITPCYAGAALAIGFYLQQFENGWSVPSRRVRFAAYWITVAIGLGISCVIVGLSSLESMPLLSRAAASGGVIALMGALGFVWESRQKIHWVPMTGLIGAAVFHVVLFGYGAKSVDRYRADLTALKQLQSTDPSHHWMVVGGLEPSWVHYLNEEIEEVQTQPDDPASWQRAMAFLNQYQDGRVIVVDPEAQSGLKHTAAPPALVASLIEIGRAPRFLRPGELSVYKRDEQLPGLSQQAQRGATETALKAPSLPMQPSAVGTESKLQAIPVSTAIPAAPQMGREGVDERIIGEPRSAEAVQIRGLRPTQPTGEQYPNPLRTRGYSEPAIR